MRIFTLKVSGMKSKLRTGYHWKVIHDPTRSLDEPGIFYGGFFRQTDIEPTANEPAGCWPEGITFEDVNTGRRIMIHNGRAVEEAAHGYHRSSV